MVLGGIVISNGELVTVNQALQKYRREEHMTSELKWTKVTNQKLGKYKLFVDHFFALNARGGAYFNDAAQPEDLRYLMGILNSRLSSTWKAVAVDCNSGLHLARLFT